MSSSSPTGQRPGGLTALGVINIIFGSLGTLGVLANVAALQKYEELRATEAGKDLPSKEVFTALMLVGLVLYVLLFVSGIGILKQKQFMGKLLANGYAILGLILALIG